MRKAVTVFVAALVVAGCGGAASSVTPGNPATASPAPASSPVAPSPSPGVPPIPPEGSMRAGTYTFLGGVGTVDVPAGWGSCCNAFGVLKGDFAALLFEDITKVIVYADSCQWKAGPNPEPKGAQAVAAAFSAQRGHQGTQPEQLTVAGLPAWHVRLTVPADQEVTGPESGDFTGCDEGRFASWGLVGGDGSPSRYQQGPSQIDDLYIVDVGNRTVVLDMVSGPDIAASDKAELDAMLASIKFD